MLEVRISRNAHLRTICCRLFRKILFVFHDTPAHFFQIAFIVFSTGQKKSFTHVFPNFWTLDTMISHPVQSKNNCIQSFGFDKRYEMSKTDSKKVFGAGGALFCSTKTRALATFVEKFFQTALL